MTLRGMILVVLVGFLLFQGPVSAKDIQEDELKKQAEELSYGGQLEKANELLGKEVAKRSDSMAGEADDGWGMTSMMLGMIWGSVGVGYFMYGKKMAKAAFLLCGIGLCVFPLFISGNVLNCVIGIGLCVIPFKVDF